MKDPIEQNNPKHHELINAREVAPMLRISERTVRRYEKKGILHAKRFGGHTWFFRKEIEKILKEEDV